MTENNSPDRQPSNDETPEFGVNVMPTVRITSAHLQTLLSHFRNGNDEPLVFGDQDIPEAVVIPFDAFRRLVKYDTEASDKDEQEFQEELTRRIASPDEESISLDELAERLGEPARSILRRTRDDDR